MIKKILVIAGFIVFIWFFSLTIVGIINQSIIMSHLIEKQEDYIKILELQVNELKNNDSDCVYPYPEDEELFDYYIPFEPEKEIEPSTPYIPNNMWGA